MTLTARFALATLALAASAAASAADINTLGNLNQAEFRQFSEDAAALVSYKPLIPAEPLGITGFDLGVSATATRLQNRAVWTKAAGGVSVPENLVRLSVGIESVEDLWADLEQALGTLDG